MTTGAIVILVIISMELGINIAKHGEDKGKYDDGIAFISFCIWISLLWWAGLFG